MKSFPLTVLTITLFVSLAQGARTSQFDHFFPGWPGVLDGIVHKQCEGEYKNLSEGTGGYRVQSLALVDCVFDHLNEWHKAQLASSAVILGLIPLILQNLGSTAAQSALLGLRRPLLATLLVAGSPAVSVIKGSSFVEEVSLFIDGSTTSRVIPGIKLKDLPGFVGPVISAAQYFIALCALGNVVHLAYRLGLNTVVIFAAGTKFMVPLWVFLAVVVHLGASVVLHLLVKVDAAESDRGTWQPRLTSASRLLDEITPHAFQKAQLMKWKSDKIIVIMVSWLVSVTTLAHIVYGTLVLSSLLFLNVGDAITIMARFAASAVACRAIARFELAGMNEKNRYRAV